MKSFVITQVSKWSAMFVALTLGSVHAYATTGNGATEHSNTGKYISIG